jgi:glucosylceramidase
VFSHSISVTELCCAGKGTQKLYLGEVEALSKVHDAHADRNIYFTEQWTSGKGDFGGDLKWHLENIIVGATRNWSRTVLEWNLASDP